MPVGPSRTQVVADLDLNLMECPSIRAPGGLLQNMMKHHYPTTSTNNTLEGQTQWVPILWGGPLLLHGDQSLEVSDHSQYLQMIDLEDKSLPLMC